MVQWLRLHASNTGDTQVQSLVGELGSSRPGGQKIRTNQQQPQNIHTDSPSPQPLALPSTSCFCGSDSSRTPCEWDQCLFFCVWLLSLSIVSSRFIQVAAGVSSFLFWLNNIPVCCWTCLFIYPSMDTWGSPAFWLL